MKAEVAIIFISYSCSVQAQGTFENLNFESATIPPSTSVDAFIPISKAFPGWSAYFTSDGITSSQNQVTYDGISTGGGMISVVDANAATPLEGNYSAYLYGGGTDVGSAVESASISQAGIIQPGTQSLLFDAYFITTPIVAINGQPLNLVPLQHISFYTLYGVSIPGADVGPSVTLSFTEPAGNLELDSISFSPLAVPEPNIAVLSAISGLLFGVRKWLARGC